MKKVVRNLFKDKYFIAVLVVFLIGTVLRFYKLGEYTTFLGDQGRDALIIKRIVTLEHLPAIGAPTSIGQVYMGPFYYYFIAPWLLLFNFQPVGLATGVAFFSSLYILINYLIVRELFNKTTALISTVLIVFSSSLIEFSRFSWNPNLLPLFTLLTVYFVIKSAKTGRWYYFALAGAFVSFSTQLHYLALFMLLPVGLLYLIQLLRKKVGLFNCLMFAVSCLIFSAPLIFFELRHNFLNTANLASLIKYQDPVTNNKLANFFSSFSSFNQFSFGITLNKFSLILILTAIILSMVFMFKKSKIISSFFAFFIVLLFGVSLYSGPKFPHYFGMVYPLYYVIVGYFLSFLFSTSFGRYFVAVFLVVFLFFNYQGYYFFHFRGGRQIEYAKNVGGFLNKAIDDKPFNFAVQPDALQEDCFLYFLELKGKVPVDRKKLEVSDQMYVVCEGLCNPLESKSWNITMFGKAKIDKIWSFNKLTIYKLTH